ncbi:MAG: DoxX family membrane protein [Flavobacteriales bacterium]|nr:DoxX family membrane protein [Flavobacteriales bacterium]
MPRSSLQHVLRIVLGVAMFLAGIGHLTFQRMEFQAQVPNWVPFDKDLVVVLSGVVEVLFGAVLLLLKRFRPQVGILLAVFFVAIFPGNVAQYLNGTDAFGLNSDTARLVRLFFQPVLVVWALWCTGGWTHLQRR